LVEEHGEAPLLLFAPDLALASAAAVRAAKLGLAGQASRYARTRLGAFPFVVVAAEALKWGDERLLALAAGDENALPDDAPVAEPALMRQLPLADLSQPVPYDGDVAEFLDRYAATLAKGPHG
jgi:hypothetical protein